MLITNSAAQELPQVAPQSPRFDNPKHEYHDTLPTVGIDKRKRQTNDRFQGYGKQKLLFKSLCAAIAEDGRNEWLYEHTKDYVRTTIGCVACKQFFKAISAPCRPRPVRLPKIKKVAEREPSANNDPESPQPEETPQEYQPPKK
ncbi:MAG: hypothetical protein KDD55_08145, partial [Bdellovibrionales bacterium]|nr:hypothetical protein [Bdellovibrionales bacterium]